MSSNLMDDPNSASGKRITDVKNLAKWIENNAIERCAQVADSFITWKPSSEIAAAIRKLKDES